MTFVKACQRQESKLMFFAENRIIQKANGIRVTELSGAGASAMEK
jgi:hypothetical protein